VGLFLHWRNETIPPPTGRGDIPWRLGTVLQGMAGGSNTAAQGIVRDELVRPQALEELIAGDDAVAMRQEIGQDIKDLRSQRDESPASTQFIALGVEAIVAKDIAHRPVSSPGLRCHLPPPTSLSQERHHT
jgi:hypothetical protein